MRALLGSALPDQLLAAVVERSDGTPLFIEELLRTWASVGTLVLADGAWHLAIEPESVALPPTVQAIYAAQLDDLPPDARQVARRGAVAGRRVPLAAFPSLDLDGRRGGLDALRRRAFVAGPFEDPITGEGYAYRHALLRDAGYASLARAERARLHVAMARWLAETAGDRADIVAEAVAEHNASALESLPAIAGGDLPDRIHPDARGRRLVRARRRRRPAPRGPRGCPAPVRPIHRAHRCGQPIRPRPPPPWPRRDPCRQRRSRRRHRRDGGRAGGVRGRSHGNGRSRLRPGWCLHAADPFRGGRADHRRHARQSGR